MTITSRVRISRPQASGAESGAFAAMPWVQIRDAISVAVNRILVITLARLAGNHVDTVDASIHR